MAKPSMLYDSETWIPRPKDYSSITAADITYLGSVNGCTRLDPFRNDNTRRDLNVGYIT